MLKNKAADFINCCGKSFLEISNYYSDIEFTETGSIPARDEQINVLINITGLNTKGLIAFQASREIFDIIGEAINGEPISSHEELELCLKEFTNIFCGKCVSKFNNLYPGTKLRLSPPSILLGSKWGIKESREKIHDIYLDSKYGYVRLRIFYKEIVNLFAHRKF